LVFSVFRLDYLSCVLTVVSTLLVGRKQWTGLLLGGVNSVIVCAIGWRTAQFGFIPANLFCIGVYIFSIRAWRRQPGRNPAPAVMAGD
jgi:nicotinamide riboside transporter PnuC